MLKTKLPLAIAVGVVSVGLFSAPASALPSLTGNAHDHNTSSTDSNVSQPETKPEPQNTPQKQATPEPEAKPESKPEPKRQLPPQPSYLDKDQIENARIIIGVGRAFNVSDRGIQIALMTAFQESDMYNLDHGDKDSKGLFQQRPKYGWGTEDEVQTRTFAAQSFYGVNPKVKNAGLLDIPGWEKMSLNDAAQAVQRSGYPDRYAQWENLAWRTLKANYDAPKIYHAGPVE
ncbi:procyclic acidic repetitive family protein [Brevibacterium sp. UMB1308A]|uniref:procyclic acidic repetitive family protein n=1 Tax=Brevibacterium sp. UMB1308A TaxID=3050608 RepID=UPI0025503FD2|nr:procyclic acidic repetitive family protein [Brevibacterium sp. UMB1308A]MDK8347702.1 procyclic acidic repetitive family protein [Brevibacterium sp. UMB1308B]MDK8714547.1 procyclic acidic repetitive family protein [Brevibacterium sp. UMB1308A]